MKRARQQRRLAGAVEFLRVYGGDPTRWAALDGETTARRAATPTSEIASLVAQAMGELERTRGAVAPGPVLGPPRP